MREIIQLQLLIVFWRSSINLDSLARPWILQSNTAWILHEFSLSWILQLILIQRSNHSFWQRVNCSRNTWFRKKVFGKIIWLKLALIEATNFISRHFVLMTFFKTVCFHTGQDKNQNTTKGLWKLKESFHPPFTLRINYIKKKKNKLRKNGVNFQVFLERVIPVFVCHYFSPLIFPFSTYF